MPGNPSNSAGLKAVFVVRGEIRLTAGKVAVQVAHAAVMLYQVAERRDRPLLQRWLDAGQKKIAVTVATLEEMEQLQRRARAAGIPAVVVEDAGLTEVPPGTKTVLGLGPALASEIDPITGGLPLL
jgi:PTH2 family peptidyl-tRNA hydrolase